MSNSKFTNFTPLLLLVLLMSISTALVTLNSCNQTQTDKGGKTTSSDSLLKAWQKPVSVGPSEEEIKQLIETVKPQREELIKTIDKNYPGLTKKYEAMVQEIIKLKNKDEINRGLQRLDSAFKKQFTDAYAKSGIDAKLQETYKNMLSKYNYKVGDLGTISIIDTVKIFGSAYQPSTPDLTDIISIVNVFSFTGCNGTDRTVTFNCPFDVHEQNSNCQAIGINFTGVSDCSLSAGNNALFVGGCSSFAKLGKNIDVDGSFQNLTSTFNVNYDISAMCIAVLIGGAYCESIVGSEMDEGNTVKVKNDHSKVWAVAPVFWYAEVHENKTNQNFICSYNRTATSSTFSVTPKVYCTASSGAGLIAGSAPFSSIGPISSLQLHEQP